MPLHIAILFRLKGHGPYKYGWTITEKRSLVQIGAYNGAYDGLWYDVDEIEWRRYNG